MENSVKIVFFFFVTLNWRERNANWIFKTEIPIRRKINYSLICILALLHRMLQPLCISELLAYFKADSKVDVTYAYFSAFSLVFSTLISVFMYHATQLEILHCGMKMRVSCCSLIYRKVNFFFFMSYEWKTFCVRAFYTAPFCFSHCHYLENNFLRWRLFIYITTL